MLENDTQRIHTTAENIWKTESEKIKKETDQERQK